jgi:hypothetical protein
LEDSEFRENGEHVGHAVNRQSLWRRFRWRRCWKLNKWNRKSTLKQGYLIFVGSK